MTNTAASPRHALPARRRPVWPIVLLLTALVTVLIAAPLFATSPLDAPAEGTYSSTWDCLLSHGWTGSPVDGAERLYPTNAAYLLCVAGA
jgi:hypothetical protein